MGATSDPTESSSSLPSSLAEAIELPNTSNPDSDSNDPPLAEGAVEHRRLLTSAPTRPPLQVPESDSRTNPLRFPNATSDDNNHLNKIIVNKKKINSTRTALVNVNYKREGLEEERVARTRILTRQALESNSDQLIRLFADLEREVGLEKRLGDGPVGLDGLPRVVLSRVLDSRYEQLAYSSPLAPLLSPQPSRHPLFQASFHHCSPTTRPTPVLSTFRSYLDTALLHHPRPSHPRNGELALFTVILYHSYVVADCNSPWFRPIDLPTCAIVGNN